MVGSTGIAVYGVAAGGNLIILESINHPKVHDFNACRAVSLAKQNILRIETTVDDTMFMRGIKTGADLLDYTRNE